MAELDKINVNGELYDMSDSKARSDIASEITNRTNADKTLDDKVKAETIFNELKSRKNCMVSNLY